MGLEMGGFCFCVNYRRVMAWPGVSGNCDYSRGDMGVIAGMKGVVEFGGNGV